MAKPALTGRRPFRFLELHNIIAATPAVATRVRDSVDRETHIRTCRSFALRPVFTEGELPDRYELEFPRSRVRYSNGPA